MTIRSQTTANSAMPLPGADAEPILLAQQRLLSSAYPALHRVECESNAGSVILRGCVSSFYFKQLAQEVVRKADGECQIVNELEVEDRSQSAANSKSHDYSTLRQGRSEAKHGCSYFDCG